MLFTIQKYQINVLHTRRKSPFFYSVAAIDFDLFFFRENDLFDWILGIKMVKIIHFTLYCVVFFWCIILTCECFFLSVSVRSIIFFCRLFVCFFLQNCGIEAIFYTSKFLFLNFIDAVVEVIESMVIKLVSLWNRVCSFVHVHLLSSSMPSMYDLWSLQYWIKSAQFLSCWSSSTFPKTTTSMRARDRAVFKRFGQKMNWRAFCRPEVLTDDMMMTYFHKMPLIQFSIGKI